MTRYKYVALRCRSFALMRSRRPHFRVRRQSAYNRDTLSGDKRGAPLPTRVSEARPEPVRQSRAQQALARKAWILAAARAVFLKQGYAGTSMDSIAAAAGVSKVTIYKHFFSKERLFAEIVRDRTAGLVSSLGETTAGLGLEETLCDFSSRILVDALNAESLCLNRIMIGESWRFPELAEAVHHAGREQLLDTVSAFLQRRMRQGELLETDPQVAAEDFIGLIFGSRYVGALLGFHPPVSASEASRMSERATRAFLTLYTPASSAASRAPAWSRGGA